MELLPWLIALLAILFVLVLLVVSAFAIWKAFEYRKSAAQIYEHYKDLIDRDTEIAARDQEIARLQTAQSALQGEYDRNVQSHATARAQAEQILANLQREIALLEETLDLQSFGVYQPHYDFATSEEYKARLEQARERQKNLIKTDRAAVCTTKWTVNGDRRAGERQTKEYIKLMLRAFNGECDATILKVRWNNVAVMEERIRKAFEVLNKMGATNATSITPDYLSLKIEELRLAYEYQEKLNQEKEEQRRINEQIREEERVQREIERAKADAEAEENRYQSALDRARAEVEKTKGAALEKLNEKIQALEQQLQAAHEMKQRAIARAQMTKAGNVYVISNIGSFGENVFKIGMTRRLEPLERIQELGDASVPFDFDVHAMIYSENAPELETKLQRHFAAHQVNLVNDRKEFFHIAIADIEDYAREHGFQVMITHVAEAKEYRETLALRTQAKSKPLSQPVGQSQVLVPAS